MSEQAVTTLVIGIGFTCVCGLLALVFTSFKKSFEDKFKAIWNVINEVKKDVEGVEKENADIVKNYKHEFKEVNEKINKVNLGTVEIRTEQKSTNDYLKKIMDLCFVPPNSKS